MVKYEKATDMGMSDCIVYFNVKGERIDHLYIDNLKPQQLVKATILWLENLWGDDEGGVGNYTLPWLRSAFKRLTKDAQNEKRNAIADRLEAAIAKAQEDAAELRS